MDDKERLIHLTHTPTHTCTLSNKKMSVCVCVCVCVYTYIHAACIHGLAEAKGEVPLGEEGGALGDLRNVLLDGVRCVEEWVDVGVWV